MAMMLKRPITSGSRQAPDPYDQFLESRCMYRKHTARDASCLFRVIAEQMYDTQMLHYEVRLECVRFMTRKRRIFEQHVRGDFDTYMLDMAKPKTYGTMLELRALCCMYRRNVILFEPFNLGTAVTYNDCYLDNFRVFYTNEFHFDSVYKLEYIETAAVSQTISFKLLYEMLFKLPDVNFAVESMLHPQTFEWGNYEVELDPRGYFVRIICSDGRMFSLDLPEHTKCILENYKLCNFHNNLKQLNRGALEYSSRRELKMSLDLPMNALIPSRSAEVLHMCPNPMNSCVRQLLDDGITPFPYKVAKSLDPFMYRNIEFDSWNDLRKEAKRYNVYANDYNFKVPYEALHPVPPDEFRPWTVPFRYQRQLQRMQLAKLAHKTKPRWKKSKLYDVTNFFEASSVQYLQLDSWHGCPPIFNEHGTLQQQSQQLQSRQQQQHQSQQQIEFNEPLELEPQQQQLREQRFHPRDKSSRPLQKRQADTAAPVLGATALPPPLATHQAKVPTAQFVNYVPMAGRAAQLPQQWRSSAQPLSEELPTGVYSGAPLTPDGCMLMHFGGYAPPQPISLQPSPQPFGTAPYVFASQPQQLPPAVASVTLPSVGTDTTTTTTTTTTNATTSNSNNNIISSSNNCTISSSSAAATTTSSKIVMRNSNGGEDHMEPKRSLHANGEDLPADLSTLRYFYNMGVDVHMRWSHMLPPGEQMGMYSNTNANQNFNNTDQQVKEINNDDTVALVANSTPPPSPVAATAVNSPSAFGTGTEPNAEKSRARNKRGGFNKMRAKRPEQLPDLNKEPSHLSHAMLLPTPTPSPNTSGNQFNFYSPIHPPMPPQPTLPSPQMPAPIFFSPPKPGQPPYAWNMGPAPVVMPFERINNYSMEASGMNAQQSPPAVYGPPRH